MHRYPTLALIEQVVGQAPVRFADDAAAASLERRAFELVSEYWSDTVWLTGLVPEAAFRTVRDALERERTALATVAVIMSADDPLTSIRADVRTGGDQVLDRVA